MIPKLKKKHYICIGLLLLFITFAFSIQITSILAKNLPFENSSIEACIGPEVKNVSFTPEKPEWYDNITITADITDPWGIIAVWINYAADKDAYAGWGANFTMQHNQDDQYGYTILNSIWDTPQKAFGAHVNFTIYAKNGLGQWSRSGYYQFYMNDSVKPIVQVHSLNNDSWLSGNVQINFSIYEEGSGIKAANLTIYDGNGAFYKQFSNLISSDVFTWNASLAIDYNITNPEFLFGYGFTFDVSSLPDYNLSKPNSYFSMNFTVWDKSINSEAIIFPILPVDNTNPYLLSLNSYKNLTTHCQDNMTITSNMISASNFINNHTTTYSHDLNYHTFTNEDPGFLQIAYGLNLSAFNLTADMINVISITLEGKISYSNSAILEAGWKIWNWIDNNFTTIDSTIFNSTTSVSDNVILSISNKSLYIKNDISQRIEIFFYVNTSGPDITADIDYLVYNLSYFEIDDWYNRDNQIITLLVKGFDLLSFDYMTLVYQNDIFYRWNSSGEYLYDFNTSLLPDGAIPLTLIVYDKAGNYNSTSILLNIDFFGPIISIISPLNNSIIGQSQITDLIVPVQLSGYDLAHNFQRMELWIDGQIGSVKSGQLGQILEYNAYGNIIYEQSNATWYKQGTYTYYWNASVLIHGSRHELMIRSYDGFGNPNENYTYVIMGLFRTNISIIDVRENYSITSENTIILEFRIINYGNSTLKDFTPNIIVPSQWIWRFKDMGASDFNYLSPGQSLTFQIEIIPKSVKNPINQSIDIIINCKIVENLTQLYNNYTIQFRTYLLVQPQDDWQEIKSTVFLILSILIGLGVGLLSIKIYFVLRELSKQPEKPPEKPKKE